MKTRFSFLTVLTVLVLSLALLTGCGSTDDDDASSSSSVCESTLRLMKISVMPEVSRVEVFFNPKPNF